MSVQAGNASASLTVILDIRYPQAYHALGPAMDFARRRRLSINWLPLSVSTLKAPEALGIDEREREGEREGERAREARSVRHRRFRALQIAREIEVYAEAQGLWLRDFYRAGDSSAFNLGWLWMRQHHGERLEDYLREAFRAYWAVEFDPAIEVEVSTLVDSLAGNGNSNGEAFRSWSQREGPVVLEKLAEDLKAQGVFGVPSYLVEDEIFLGRQHLPMIDWVLDGRTGQIPI
jgi:2-hydroxychromene-2-carboxylate isomerase